MSKPISVKRLKDHILKGDTKEMVRVLSRALPHQIRQEVNGSKVQKELLKRYVMVKEVEAMLIKGAIWWEYTLVNTKERQHHG